eukprot:scaffold2302_cov153-Skeletonema_dohrnii-CCMP3373.AAC.7
MKFHLAIVPFLQVAAWNLNGVQTFKRNNAQHLSESFLALENTSIANNVMLWNPLDSGATTLKEKKSQRVITSATQESMASKKSWIEALAAVEQDSASTTTNNDEGDAGANVTPNTSAQEDTAIALASLIQSVQDLKATMASGNKELKDEIHDMSIRLQKVEVDMSRDSDDPVGTVITTTGPTPGQTPPTTKNDTATTTAVKKALATSPSDVRTTTVDPVSLENKSKVPPTPQADPSDPPPSPQARSGPGGASWGIPTSARRGPSPSPIQHNGSPHYHSTRVGDPFLRTPSTGHQQPDEQHVEEHYQRGQTIGLTEDGELWMKGGDPVATVAYGIDHITDSDFTSLGISSKDTSYRAQIRRDHKKLYHGWIGTAMNYKAGPQVSRALDSSRRPTLQSESSAGFVKLWDATCEFLSNYYMGIVPFGVINMSDSYWKIGIPGIGVFKQELIAGELFIYLKGVFQNTKLAGINYAIDIVGRRGGNGFDLLKELGTSVFPVFNMGKVIDPPTFLLCDRDTWRLATEMDIFHRIMRKRGLVPNTKSKAMLFLEQLQGHVPAAAALLSVLETQSDENVDVHRWDIMALGRQFSLLPPPSMALGSGEHVPSLQHHQPSAMVNNTHALFTQGYQAQCHFTQQQGRQVKPRDKFDPRRLPDPKKRRLPGYVDGQICEACGKANHTANTCRFLVASIYLKLYQSKYPQQCKALEASVRKRLDTKPPPKRVNLLSLVDDYSASTGFSVNKIVDEMAWDTFYDQVEYVEESDDEEEEQR